MIVNNNGFGISTKWDGQHGEKQVSDRGKAFGIRTKTINGLDLFEVWEELSAAMDYVRTERKPFLLEVMVSRMNGHSSASGANRNSEADPIVLFEEKLLKQKVLSKDEIAKVWERAHAEANESLLKVRQEPFPEPSSIYDHVWAEENGDKGRDTFAEKIGVDFSATPVDIHH
jgi:2-oxoisovalerate dehydrogenase E1 component alpha subunit